MTVELTPLAGGRCRLLLRHSLAPVETAICHAPGFGAGWEGFFDWLDDALAGRAHGPDERYEAVLPAYAAFGERLSRVSEGIVEVGADGRPAVRHRRVVAAPAENVWRALTEPAGLARWLGVVVEGRLGPGERVVIVHDESDPDASRQTSTVRTWQPTERLAMTWEMAGEPDSYVEITLAESGRSTVLELVHRGVGRPGDDYLPGWHAHLDLLVAEAVGSGRPSWSEAFRAAQQLT